MQQPQHLPREGDRGASRPARGLPDARKLAPGDVRQRERLKRLGDRSLAPLRPRSPARISKANSLSTILRDDKRIDIGGWLRSLDLGRYEQAFRDNEIDEQILPSLTPEDLKEIGVGPVGHCRKLLEAIRSPRGQALEWPSTIDVGCAIG
jgi:hypothetical protein